MENSNAPMSADDFLHIMGWGDFSSSAGVRFNVDNAIGIPAVWYAVAPQGGVVEEIDGVTDTFLLSNRDIDRFNDKHRGIFEVWDGFFKRGIKPSYKELKRIKLSNFRKKSPARSGRSGGAVDTIILEGRPNIHLYSWQRVRWIK